MGESERYGLYCGVVGPIVSVVAVLLATLVDSAFSWREQALSNLGEHPDGETFVYAIETGQAEFFLFNGGLLVTAVIGLGFAWVLFDGAENVVERIGAGLYAIGLVGLACVAIVHLGHDYHFTVSVVYFVTAGFALLWYGGGRMLEGHHRYGLLTFGTGLAFALTWLLWATVVPDSAASGVAIPEFVSSMLFASWSFGTASARLWGDRLWQTDGERLDRPA